MGAARTGIAALKLKRRFIGSEEDKDTFALAKTTIDRELSYIGATMMSSRRSNTNNGKVFLAQFTK